jgi:hypothetical protein
MKSKQHFALNHKPSAITGHFTTRSSAIPHLG